MKIYFLRHGEADWPNWDRPDAERPLTKKGKKEIRRVASFLSNLNISPALLLSSPLPRAYETAELAADELDLSVTEEESLAPGFDLPKLVALLKKYPDQDLMLVGHEPDFTTVIGALTGGKVKLPKAGVARVDLDNPNSQEGMLIWLVPPKVSAS